MIETGLLLIILAVKFRPRLQGLSYEWLDSWIERREAAHGRLIWALQLALILTGLACLYGLLDTQPEALGVHYSRLAENPFPFDPSVTVSYRILTPLISYCLGLRGDLIIITNLLITVAALAVVYSDSRKRYPRPGDAFLAVVILTFSLVVLTSIHCGGYCDILTYLLIYLMWQHREKRIIFYVLFLLGLLNRESVAFLMPWFCLISLQAIPKKWLRVVELAAGFGVSLGVYWMFRLWIDSQMEVGYDLAYYIEPFLRAPLKMFKSIFYYHGIGLFSVFKALWVIPCLAALSMWRERKRSELTGMVLLMACSYSQLFIAYDSSRMFTLGFMVMIIALHYILKNDIFEFRKWCFWAVLFNLMIPQIYTASTIIQSWQSLASHMILKIL